MTFFEWVRSVGGVAEAAKLAKVPQRLMGTWYYSERVPKPVAARALIRASKGQLCFNTIYGPILAKVEEKEAKALIKRTAQGE